MTPGEARSFVTQRLADEVSGPAAPDAIDSARLVVSELVTNAVQAGCSELNVDVQVRRESLLISVDDDAAGWPRPENPALTATHGRGLRIVAALARDWGARATTTGKVVWAELDLAGALVHATACRS